MIGDPRLPLPMTTASEPTPPAHEIRDDLIAALHADLIGPYAGREAPDAPEVLSLPPSRWYLAGFLAPELGREVEDPTQDDEGGAGDDTDGEDSGEHDQPARQRKIFPASLGLSVILTPEAGDTLLARVRWAEYVLSEVDRPPGPDGKSHGKQRLWTRHPRGPFEVQVPLDAARLADDGLAVPGAPGVRLVGKLERGTGHGLGADSRALSLFIVNRRPVPEPRRADESFLFQVEVELVVPAGLCPRPNRALEHSTDFDERISDLQYRGHFEYAVGHGVSVALDEHSRIPEGHPTRVRTCWLPTSEVRRVRTHDDPEVVTDMSVLANLAGPDAERALGEIVTKYTTWLADQAKIDLDSTRRREARDELLHRARMACQRIRGGIDLLASDPEVLRAFCLTNRAMAMMAQQRGRGGHWYMFQLAFLLQNLASISDPLDAHRDDVELIFFPTGGGKTEAYLGVIALTLLMRRLRGRSRPDGGLGVAILLRYTLRLLTLDQLGRAATLVCALELLREEYPSELGDTRFAVGLWVGRSATANTIAEVATKVTEYKNNRGPSPFPLTKCPWCNHNIERDSLVMWPATKPIEVRVSCVRAECRFSGRSTRGIGFPVLFVDEQIYRELPAFLISTVDKFAMLPWRGDTGSLFGHVTSRDGRQFFGPIDGGPRRGATPLPRGLRPPELIVQDELHLISGPLGTMVGLYEAAIERLCTFIGPDGAPVRPKIIASTATVRRAGRQIQALFGRPHTNLFPPPGVDVFETFFATVDHKTPGRRYVGVAGPGRAMKAILLRTYIALLGAAAKAHDPRGPKEQPADGYMTVAGYFNSLRELGGMRRLVEDDVRTRCARAEERCPEDEKSAHGGHRWARDRRVREPVELTSRESQDKIRDAKARLELPHGEGSVDVLLASNMISVGIDIDRLGLMVVAGQPKTTSEYIQASSRVGRPKSLPGLVVTCFNVHKPRDRSHYEYFAAYHESFYRHVEAQSLTPFSARALDRGHAGILTALVRLGDPTMTPPEAVMDLPDHRVHAEAMNNVLADRAAAQPAPMRQGDSEAEPPPIEGEADRVRDLGINILDAWQQIVGRARKEGAGRRSYSPYDRPRSQGKPLLHSPLDDTQAMDDDEKKFAAPTSMRDVEPTVHLWIERNQLGGRSR